MNLEKVTNTKAVLIGVSWIALATSLLLFLPSKVLNILFLDKLVIKFSSLIGLFFILSCALLSTHLAYFIFTKLLEITNAKLTNQKITDKINLLDPIERAVLREFFLRSATSLSLPKNEPAVKSLVEAKVLEYLGNDQNYAIQDVTADYKISMVARSMLNRQILRLPPAGDVNTEEMQAMLKARPKFLINIIPQRK